MAKKIDGYIKLNIPAGASNPSPPVGPALGQRGINIMEFCKEFNASTEKLEKICQYLLLSLYLLTNLFLLLQKLLQYLIF